MMSDFIHSETSAYGGNTLLSMARITPWGAGHTDYAAFTGGPGCAVSVHNQTDEWKYVGGGASGTKWLNVRGNVDRPITGYSLIRHIYLYSNPTFMTVTPTSTATAAATPTITATPSLAVTATQSSGYEYNRTAAVAYANQWAHSRNENYPNYGVDADGDQCKDCTNYISQILEAGGDLL